MITWTLTGLRRQRQRPRPLAGETSSRLRMAIRMVETVLLFLLVLILPDRGNLFAHAFSARLPQPAWDVVPSGSGNGHGNSDTSSNNNPSSGGGSGSATSLTSARRSSSRIRHTRMTVRKLPHSDLVAIFLSTSSDIDVGNESDSDRDVNGTSSSDGFVNVAGNHNNEDRIIVTQYAEQHNPINNPGIWHDSPNDSATFLSTTATTSKTTTADPLVASLAHHTSAAIAQPADMASSVTRARSVPDPTIRSSLKQLIALTRPNNFPGIVLFHTLAVYLTVRSLDPSLVTFFKVLFLQPAMWLTLLALLLTSSTSMLVNDYYDFKLGRDVNKHKALVEGQVTLRVARRFVSYLYAAALMTQAFLPGAVTRCSVISGLMLTYLYTEHLKPMTWLKNAVCAGLIALSPLTSSSAALHVMTASTLPPSLHWWHVTQVPGLLRLVGALFCGVAAREMLMDCVDTAHDGPAGVRTVSVVYGPRFAAQWAAVGNLLMTVLLIAGPIRQRGILPNSIVLRRGVLAILAGGIALGGNIRVVEAMHRQQQKMPTPKQTSKTDPLDPIVIQRLDHAIHSGLFSVLLLLASFV